MQLIDAFKALGFDHLRHSSFDEFEDHWTSLQRHGLQWRVAELIGQLARFNVIGEEIEFEDQECIQHAVFDSFFRFWLEATRHLASNESYTLEDQKYFAYLHEKESVAKGSFLSGAAGVDHVLVDEFQDINPLDLALVSTVVRRRRATLTIAGDDDQAIFEWRGATPNYILDPDRFFDLEPSFATYTLGVNYRSPENIVKHSQMLIGLNKRRVEKHTSAFSTDLAAIDEFKVDSLSESLDYVLHLVKSSIERGASPAQIAIIGRKRSQLIPYQVFFASNEITFCAAEDLHLFLSKAFDRLLRLLTIKEVAERSMRLNEVAKSLMFLCNNVPRWGLKDKTRLELRTFFNQRRPRTLNAGIDCLYDYGGGLGSKNQGGETGPKMAEAILAYVQAESVSDSLYALSAHFNGLQRDFGKAEEDIFYVDPPFEQLAEYARSYGSDYEGFVGDIELAQTTLVKVPPANEDDDAEDISKYPLHLMTALRAKGKEFNCVVLIDVQDGVWPSSYADTEAKLEAERRVFYVAFTRARQQVTMLLRKGEPSSPYIEELGLNP